jgi:hypothetical protein
VKVPPMIEADEPNQCRNKMSLAWDRRAGRLSFAKENSIEAIVFDYCEQTLPINQAVYESLGLLRLPSSVTRVHIRAFFQTSCPQSERLQRIISSFARLEPGDAVIDLYCGVGFFDLDLAAKSRSVYGVEHDRQMPTPRHVSPHVPFGNRGTSGILIEQERSLLMLAHEASRRAGCFMVCSYLCCTGILDILSVQYRGRISRFHATNPAKNGL